EKRSLLDRGERELDLAEAEVERLHGLERWRRLGSIYQIRGLMHQVRGDLTEIERALRAAIDAYEGGELAMEAANCRFLIGVLHLNGANEDLVEHFGTAEELLSAALAYYVKAGMRGQSANTRFMLARLYANALPRVPGTLREQLCDAAL